MILRGLENIPTDSALETDLRVYGQLHSIDSLREPLQNSVHGVNLANLKPRFSFYWQKYWPDFAKFAELYGPDVDPVQHGPYQARTIAIPMVDAQRSAGLSGLSGRTGEAFVAHTVQHDDHEGTEAKNRGSDRDRQYIDRTAQHEHDEFELWKDIHRELFGEEASRTQIWHATRFEHGNGFAGTLFGTKEFIGYLATGIQSIHIAMEEPALLDIEREGAWEMGRRVVAHHYQNVAPSREVIAYSDTALSHGDEAIRAITDHFDVSREELFASEVRRI